MVRVKFTTMLMLRDLYCWGYNNNHAVKVEEWWWSGLKETNVDFFEISVDPYIHPNPLPLGTCWSRVSQITSPELCFPQTAVRITTSATQLLLFFNVKSVILGYSCF